MNELVRTLAGLQLSVLQLRVTCMKHSSHNQQSHAGGRGRSTAEALDELAKIPDTAEGGWLDMGKILPTEEEPYEDPVIFSDQDLTTTKVKIDSLIGTQAHGERSTVEAYIKDPNRTPMAGASDKPLVVKVGNSLYVHDGHHRVAAQKLRGVEEIEVSVYKGRWKQSSLDDDDWDNDDWDDE